VLTDFIAYWTPPPCHPGSSDDSEPGPRALVFNGHHWTLFFDGSSRKQGGSAEVLLHIPNGEEFKYMVPLDFKEINNMAEYEAIIFGLSTTLSPGAW
jgi:hypothetical protein